MRGLAHVAALALCLAPVSALGGNPDQLKVGKARIDVIFEGPTPDLPHQAFLDWIAESARGVSCYFGRFPVEHYRVRVRTVDDRRGVHSGRTWGFGGAHSEVYIGRKVTRPELADDWVMTHEMVHVAFPGGNPAWMQEGVATYVEPLARAFAGSLSMQWVWSELVEGIPKGMPAPDGLGLDDSEAWGSQYWGGAFFFLRADVEIRRRTHDRLGLIDALRGILAAGGNDEADWNPARTFTVGDTATGVNVLQALWAEMGPKPMAPKLDLLWGQLGVPLTREGQFDDAAPDAAIRRAIGTAPAGAACGVVTPAMRGPPPH